MAATKRFFSSQYQGMVYEKIREIRAKNVNPAIITYYKEPLLVDRASMQYVYDHKGKKYLDLLGGIVTVSVGHCHPKVNHAVKEQMDKVWHSTNIYLHVPLHRYVEKLTSKMTGDLDNVYIVNSGSEANDLALMLARLYTKNMEIISLQNSYHGLTSTILGIMNMGTWKHKPIPNFATHAVINPDPYRGPWGGAKCRDCPVQAGRDCKCTDTERCNACDRYIELLENYLKHSVLRNGVAAMIVESIQGAGGTVQFPKGYVKRAFELVRQYGGICISDEVQTGFGRTGEHFWGYEMHGVQPDIVVMAKGIANGFPMAALVTRRDIGQSLANALHFNTFGGNPLACTAASAVLDVCAVTVENICSGWNGLTGGVIEKEKLQQNSHEVGTYFLQKLASLRDKIEIIGDVRGKGLMIGVELVESKETRKPLEASRMANVLEKTKNNGILIGKGGLHGTVLRIKPPMCINKKDVDFAIDALELSLKNV